VNNEWRRNRLGAPGINNGSSKGILSMADDKKNDVPVVERPPSQALEIAKKVGIALGLLAAGIVGAASSGIALPPVLVVIANAILAILIPLGLASPGLKQAPPAPRVGPPEP
jgi:hypothetical protein